MATKKSSPSKKKASSKKKPAASTKAVSKKKASSRKKTPVKKKIPAKKKKSILKRKKSSAKSSLKTKALSFLVSFGLVAGALFIAFVMLYPHSEKKIVPHKIVPQKTVAPKVAQTKKKALVKTSQVQVEKPEFEIFPAKPIPSRRPISSSKRIPVSNKRPKVAIVIDDLGYHMKLAKNFLNLDAILTCSILPYSKYQDEILALAKKKGAQVMLHLPMEPNEYPDVDPGPGALYTAMTPDERITQLKAVLDSVPGIKGVNNHMGSKMTTMSDQMNQIFTILKKRGLFFIDSRTTAASQCRSSARLFKVPFAERDVFLDHIRTKDAIRAQIEQLVNMAQIYGQAVGIAHPHHITFEVLSEALPDLKKKVKLVFASEIVEVL